MPDLMDVVVDLPEIGTTLHKNGRKIIGQIMESHTVMVANRKARADPEKQKAIEEIRMLLFGVIRTRTKVLLTMNVTITAMKTPTVNRLHGIDYYSIQTVVPKNRVNELIPKLKSCGAEDILEIPVTKIVP